METPHEHTAHDLREGRPPGSVPKGFIPDVEAEAASRQSVLTAENASLQDRVLRALADAENTRRQAERAVAEARKYAIVEFAREMLGVSDNLQRTLLAAEQLPRSGDNPLLTGVRATERMLASIFERFGLRKIAAQAVPFDPNVHEALMEVDDRSVSGGDVASVLEEGYTIHDRLVRPSRVAVARRWETPLVPGNGPVFEDDTSDECHDRAE
jgi:molecular chaperone GrpE